jgi:hypothetical protein
MYRMEVEQEKMKGWSDADNEDEDTNLPTPLAHDKPISYSYVFSVSSFFFFLPRHVSTH